MEQSRIKDIIILEVEVKDRNGTYYDVFIGSEPDISNNYHVLGVRPRKFRNYIPQCECISRDLGTVRFPWGKYSPKKLSKGDTIGLVGDDIPDGLKEACYTGREKIRGV